MTPNLAAYPKRATNSQIGSNGRKANEINEFHAVSGQSTSHVSPDSVIRRAMSVLRAFANLSKTLAAAL